MLLLFLLSISTIYCSFQEMIFSQLNEEYKEKNLIISPLSIYQALSLTTNGAKSDTQKEMLEVLGSENLIQLNDINYDILETAKNFKTVEIANAIMSKFTSLEEFEEVAEKYFAPIQKLESAEQVNDWCSDKTHGKISQIIDKLDPETVMIILNAVYFKGEWITKFVSEDTYKSPFYNYNNKDNEIEVDTMIQTNYFNYYEDSEIQLIELDYRDDSMSAIIILPSEEIDINEYIKSLNSNNTLMNIIDNLDYKYIHFEFPKFKVDFYSSLSDVLRKLGIKKAFSNSANFRGLNEKEELYISDVIHKTFLEVTEDGTEAAAVTAVIVDVESVDIKPKKPLVMKVNRPFLLLLRNKDFPNGYNFLFMSKITELQ